MTKLCQNPVYGLYAEDFIWIILKPSFCSMILVSLMQNLVRLESERNDMARPNLIVDEKHNIFHCTNDKFVDIRTDFVNVLYESNLQSLMMNHLQKLPE